MRHSFVWSDSYYRERIFSKDSDYRVFQGYAFLNLLALLIQRNYNGRPKKIVQEMIDVSFYAKWESRFSTTKFVLVRRRYSAYQQDFPDIRNWELEILEDALL